MFRKWILHSTSWCLRWCSANSIWFSFRRIHSEIQNSRPWHRFVFSIDISPLELWVEPNRQASSTLELYSNQPFDEPGQNVCHVVLRACEILEFGPCSVGAACFVTKNNPQMETVSSVVHNDQVLESVGDIETFLSTGIRFENSSNSLLNTVIRSQCARSEFS